MNVYLIYDKKLCKFLPFVFLAENDDICKRNIIQVLRDGANNNFLMFPNDFNVHCVAEFNLDLGEFGRKEHYLAFELITLFSKSDVVESEVDKNGVQDSL